jgi:7-cyano-7-deazaguanine synthase
MDKTVILLGGGMDSLAALHLVTQSEPVDRAFFFSYGRNKRTHKAAQDIAERYNIPLTAYPLQLIVPLDYTTIGKNSQDKVSHYLADRNLLFLSYVSAACKVNYGKDSSTLIVTGFCKGVPGVYDITPDFVLRVNSLLYLDTYARTQVFAPFVGQDKKSISEYIVQNNVPVHLSYSCYEERELHCGKCLACTSRRAAFTQAGLTDPTEYEEEPVEA